MGRLSLFLSVILILISACGRKKTLFTLHSADESGINFNNTITETDSINVLDFENVYNGGGVGMGDFNGDGLQDIYFTGNMVPNKLYLNEGKFKFRDITDAADVAGGGKWCRGVSVIDINNDGKLDIYACASVKRNPKERENLLYVNQGNDTNNQPLFKEMAAEYGLNDTTHSTMAAFFDYDNDGDLDVYICVNDIIKGDFPNRFRKRMTDGEHPSTGRLYRNDWNDALKHGIFTNVSREAGILTEGYGHNVAISDINRDGWQDIYVTNDYLSQNILYINNGNGTFTDKVQDIFKHTSANSMGADISDINNDGLVDVVELDMNPQDNFRKKMMLNANSYQTYQNSDYLGYQYQYVRNTLQLNRGFRTNSQDSIGDPVFSDVAFYAGIAETDWSWAPLVNDFDNDGYRDIIITNGFPRDVTDHDFVSFRKEAFSVTSRQQLLEQIPEVKIHNYAFHNNGDCQFTNKTFEWGLQTPSFSNGAAYADLDNDGDMDFVVNNINDAAFVYENNLKVEEENKQHFLGISLAGEGQNRNGIGAWIELHYGGKMQVYEHSPYRGYLSSVQLQPHFGLGASTAVDSIIVYWPGKRKQVLTNVKTDQVLTVDIKNASNYETGEQIRFAYNSVFTEISGQLGIDYKPEERDFVDFNIQKLLPHKFSENGPALAVGDLDGNGLDDLVAGSAYGKSPILFLQMKDAKFAKKNLITDASDFNKKWEDGGILVFDADNDGDQDLYVSGGGYENQAQTGAYGDRLFINDGNAGFEMDTTAIPRNYTSKSCVRTADFDKDGDLDLFIGGRVEPWNYPRPVSSFIYRNDSKAGSIKFTDITTTIAPSLQQLGLVSDAVWSDYDNDGWVDLVIAGEWMPLTFLKNENGKFSNTTVSTGISNYTGWWRSLVPCDFDNDGDIDYAAGNLGLNSYYRASVNYPVRIYAKDFDKNGSFDAIPTLYLPATLQDTAQYEYPAHVRDDMVKQMIGFRAKFQNYKLYATATFDKMFSKEEMNNALILQANTFAHAVFRNDGGGKFTMIPLPAMAQISCINGMIAGDMDGDGLSDLLVNGNDYGTEVSVGRYDACNGILLKGNGKMEFTAQDINKSGIYIPANGKALVQLRDAQGSYLVAASQNRGPVKVFRNNKRPRVVDVKENDAYAEITFTNGSKQKIELDFGSSWLSQSGRFLAIPGNTASVEITNIASEKRKIPL